MAKRLMAVHAHPDDESSKGAATYARYLREGVEVMVVTCTGGERGDVLNEEVAKNPQSRRDLAGLRREEMRRAQEVVGFQHRGLGYVDSGMASDDGTVPAGSFADVPVEISAEVLVNLVREFKPHVMVTYNEHGGYPHPDHIRCHEISYRAFEVAGNETVYPDAGEPWQVSKLYYDEIFNLKRILSMQAVLRERDPELPLLETLDMMAERMAQRPQYETTKIHVGDFFELRDDALRAHASQVAPDNAFFFWPNELQREAWPFEDFRLAASHVETSAEESDLFQGIVQE
jgi:mycothiol S-conjugate amidase